MLTAEQYEKIKTQLDTPGAIKDEAYRSAALRAKEEFENQQLDGWAKAGGTKADSAPAAPGELGVKGIIGGEAPVYDTQFGPPPPPEPGDELVSQLDPRYDLVPQVLSMAPATTDPDGDAAAAEKWQAGDPQGEMTIVYEPPLAIVKKQLIENPEFLRILRSDDPPPLEEITGLTADSPLYQDAANYMWRQTAAAAAQNGKNVYRYAKAPWFHDEQSKGALDTLGLKLGGAVAGPMTQAKNAFVLGVDDTATFGAGRALQETMQPERRVNSPGTDVMGRNEAVKQDTSELNAETIEEHPLAHAAGQTLGALSPWGAVERLYQGVMRGGRALATKLGASKVPAAAGFAGRGAGNVAANTGATAGQEAIDLGATAIQEAEPPSAEQAAAAGQRVLDSLSPGGVALAAGGEALGAAAHGGANIVRDSERYGWRLRAAEPHLNLGPSTVITGPRLGPELQDVTRRAAREGKQPGDYIAQDIAPAIQREARKGVDAAETRAGAEARNYHQTPEGQAELPSSRLQEASLEKLRDHHQPRQDGALDPVDSKFGEYQRVFNKTVGDVSAAPIDGAVRLSPAEAEQFLSSRWRYKLLKDDIEKANANAGAPRDPIDRDAYLRTIKDSRTRQAVEDEIEASIEDIVGDTGSAAKRAAAEQQVLQELVDEASFVEANGSLAQYLEQRGVEGVYVKPSGLDARRADTRLRGLGDEDLRKAAELDRQMRPKDGERGGWSAMRERHAADIAEAKDIQQSVAPGGKAFEPIARTARSTPGEKELVDRVEALASRAGPGTRQKYDRLRTMQDANEIALRSRFRGGQGEAKSYASGQSKMDALQLRAFPVLRALEGPLGPVGGPGMGALGRAPLIGSREEAFELDDSARGRYERARAARLAEIAAAKESRSKERERKRTETIRRRP